MKGTIGAFWGVGGVVLLLTSAVMRLTPIAMAAFHEELLWYHWAGLLAIVFGMAYAEGYVGFQQRFSPRVAARARYLREHANLLHTILAPFFCMGYFHATKRRRITSISLTAGIIVLIILVRFLSQPWRGIIDAGVVVGLAWGICSVVMFSVQAFTAPAFPYSPEVPEA